MVVNSYPTFRPSIVICVGKTGERIREHLSPFDRKAERVFDAGDERVSVYHLLSNLDPRLRDMVSLLQVITDGSKANFDEAIPIPIDQSFVNDADMPQQPGPLESVIYQALFSVQLDRRITNIRSGGYTIRETRAQIFIVGEALDDEKDMRVMANVLTAVHKVARRLGFEPSIFYCLNTDLSGDHHRSLQKLYNTPGLKWTDYYLANFAHLYENVIPLPSPVTQTPKERQYAIAESIFGLIATGMTGLPTLETDVRLPADLQDYSDHVGSVSTSMVYFPHAAVRKYSSSKLGTDLMREWRDSLEKNPDPGPDQQRLENQARALAKEILSWMQDTKVRQATEDLFGPNMLILRSGPQASRGRRLPRQKEVIRQLDKLEAALFRLFIPEIVEEEYNAQNHKPWTALAINRKVKATGEYGNWERQAYLAWEDAQRVLDDEIRQETDKMWESSDTGFSQAKIFIDELDVRLKDIIEEMSSLRERHDRLYDRDCNEFREKGLGEWNDAASSSTIMGPDVPMSMKLTPTITTTPPDAQLQGAMGVNTPGGPGGGMGAIGGSGGGPPLPEELIELNLERRVDYKQGLIPPLGTLLSIGALGAFALYEALKVLPDNLPTFLPWQLPALPFPWQVPVTCLGLLAVAALNLSLRLTRGQDLRAARKDLLAFFRRYFAHECEKREDRQRMKLLQYIKGRVMQKRHRLATLSTLFQNLENQQSQEAVEVEEQLFAGPGGQRDILVANGERLQRTGNHTLATIHHQINQVRLHQPLEEWHHSLGALKARLMLRLRAQTQSLLEMSEDEIQMHLTDFITPVIDGYLTGTLADVALTLDKAEMWREIIERVSKPMYYAKTGMRDPQRWFICGANENLAKIQSFDSLVKAESGQSPIPENVDYVTTRSPEWLIVAAFFWGGEPPKFNADVLFPVK
ncbi:MAG TPA: hypothetical protein VGD98_10150 [Ktedonobacteraceae bacterium]